MKIVCSTLVFLLLSVLSAYNAGITVSNPAGFAGKSVVRAGIPLPPGVCRDTEKFGVFSGTKQLSAQFAVLSRYPDNSVRWVSADFSAPLEGKQIQKFSLNTSSDKRCCDGSVSVIETPDIYLVDTG